MVVVTSNCVIFSVHVKAADVVIMYGVIVTLPAAFWVYATVTFIAPVVAGNGTSKVVEAAKLVALYE